MSQVRKPAVAGYFYPSDPSKLKDEVGLLLQIAAEEKVPEKVFGIISPHAGYTYSGKTAAHAYNLLNKDKVKTVIILSPSHREYFPGVSVFDGDSYQTPLGEVSVNKKTIESLTRNSKTIFKGKEGHLQEHAIEVQLPFLQMVLEDFEIVPVVMGDQGKIFVEELSDRIVESFDDNTVVISSSDLSHYYSGAIASQMDSIVEREINNFNYEELQENFEKRRCEACGAGTILTLMKSAYKLKFNKSKVLFRCDSGDTTGDKHEVVGYLSAVFYGD